VLGSGAGFSGAAIIGGSLVLTVLASGTRIIHWYPWEALRFDRVEAGRVLNVGVPAGLEQIQFNIAFMTYTRIIATLGTTALAAHGVTLAIQSLTFNVGFGLSVATTALVGQSLGAHRPDLAERSTYVTMRYSLAFMVALGAVLMMEFARRAARYFPHVEIIELHHDRKRDAPSGTAARTARLVAAARGTPPPPAVEEMVEAAGARGASTAGVPVHSVRLPGLVAHQEVIFGGPGQTLTIRHDSTSEESFMPGLVLAIQRVGGLRHLVEGLEHVLEP